MVRKIRSFCATCLALRGLLACDTEAFTVPRSHHPSRLARRARNGASGRAHGGSSSSDRHNFLATFSRGNHEHVHSPAGCAGPSARLRYYVRSLDTDMSTSQSHDAGCTAVRDTTEVSAVGIQAGTSTTAVGSVHEVFIKTVLTSILAVGILFLPGVGTSLGGGGGTAHANSADSTVEVYSLTPTVENRDSAKPAQVSVQKTSPRRVRPPPPEIPPGRITIAQWVSRTLAQVRLRYLPRNVDLKAAAIPALTEFGKIAEEAKRDLGESVVAVKERRGFGSGWELLTSGVEKGNKIAVQDSLSTGNASPVPEQKSFRQEQIDALKAELLDSQARPSQPAPKLPVDKIPEVRENVVIGLSQLIPASPGQYKVGDLLSSAGKFGEDKSERARTGNDATGGKSSGVTVSSSEKAGTKARVKPTKSDRKNPASVDGNVVDLKAELRAESDKAAKTMRAPRRFHQPSTVKSQITVNPEVLGQSSPASTAESEAKETTKSTGSRADETVGTKGGALKESIDGGRSGVSMGDGAKTLDDAMSAAVARIEGTSVTAQSPLDALDFARASEQAKDAAAQVQKLADEQGKDAAAGFAAVVEQGRANVDRLQSEANRISLDLDKTAAPLAEKLSEGASTLPQKGRATGQAVARGAGNRFSEISAISERALSSVVDRVRGLDLSQGVYRVKDATGKFSEMVVRGASEALPSAQEAGRTIGEGLTELSKTAVDGIGGVSAAFEEAARRMPDVQGGASALTSQLADASNRATAQAGGAFSSRANQISEQVSANLAKLSPPDLSTLNLDSTATQARDTLARFSKRTFSGSFPKNLSGVFSGKIPDDAASAARSFIVRIRNEVTAAIGSEASDTDGVNDLEYIAGAAALSTVTLIARGAKGRGGGAAEGRGVVRLEETGGVGFEEQGGVGFEEREARPLQPIGVSKEAATAAGVGDGGRYSAETMSAAGTLWDMIRESGTGAGDAVREVSQKDLLARAAEVAGELRATSEGLEILKAEVAALRKSIRDSDLEGKAKALREALAAALEGEGLGVDKVS